MSRPRDWSADDNRRRLEDLTFMADHGETPEGAAERLALTSHALRKWCERHHALHLWNQLRANQYAPGHGARAGHVIERIA